MRVFNYLSAIILSGLTLSLILLPYLTPERAGNLIFISLLAIPILLADGIVLAVSLWKRKRCGYTYSCCWVVCLYCLVTARFIVWGRPSIPWLIAWR